ncbi:MAG: ParB/RepB/Spo0J family partition protein [Nitriliruptorales bacterium]|nr:ParB/RepB/Spo0J family partition protein [Nitriliruptorales bacterium]
MMARPGGLGRGLGALIPNAGPGTSGLLTLEISSIAPNPRQPRGGFDPVALQELAQSIRQVGMLQPIIVRPRDDGKYEIVAGERRYRAARMAEMELIPAVVRHTADANLLTEALVENIHRADLNPLEEAAAYDQLLSDFGMTHEALATHLGKSRSAISNALRLLALPPVLQERVLIGALTAGHARALLALEDVEHQEQMAQRVVSEGLSVRATEDLVRQAVTRPNEAEERTEPGADPGLPRRTSRFSGLERRLEDALATKVQIRGSDRRGRLVIDYAGREDLERLLDILGRGAGASLLAEE